MIVTFSTTKTTIRHCALRTMLALCGAFYSALSSAALVVIVNPSNTSTIDQAYVKNIFLGKTKKFPNGEKAVPFEIEEGDLRKDFIEHVLQKNEGALNSHWSRMIFTGKAMPPKAYKTEQELKKIVAENPSAIGFIDSSNVDSSVRVISLTTAAP